MGILERFSLAEEHRQAVVPGDGKVEAAVAIEIFEGNVGGVESQIDDGAGVEMVRAVS